MRYAAFTSALVIFCSVAYAADWTPIADKLSKSVVYIESKSGSCTGFVINSKVEKEKEPDRTYILTAAHCNGEDIYADQSAAKVLHLDNKKDLMVLAVDALDRPALKLATENPKIGQTVASYGFGWGLERPMLRQAMISDDNTYIPEDGIGGPFMVIDAQFVPGMSGGPVVNQAGDVVMIVQRGGGAVGIGVGEDIIRSKTGKYWEKPKPKP